MRNTSNAIFEAVVEWISELMGEDYTRNFLQRSNCSLYHACFSGDIRMLSFAISIMENCRLLKEQINLTYTHEKSGEMITLLLMLCKNNSDTQCITLLLNKGFENFDNPLSFNGKNCLHYAIWYGNLETVQALLSNDRCREFHLKQLYNGMSAIEYARSLSDDEAAATNQSSASCEIIRIIEQNLD